jgi:hypothetical protein
MKSRNTFQSSRSSEWVPGLMRNGQGDAFVERRCQQRGFARSGMAGHHDAARINAGCGDEVIQLFGSHTFGSHAE